MSEENLIEQSPTGRDLMVAFGGYRSIVNSEVTPLGIY